MDSKKRDISNRKLSVIIALVYVGFGTYYAYFSTNNLITDGFYYYFFFPVSALPSLIIFTEQESILLILICQLFTLVFIIFIVWGFVNVFRKEKEFEEKFEAKPTDLDETN